jgi:hypothetical protein
VAQRLTAAPRRQLQEPQVTLLAAVERAVLVELAVLALPVASHSRTRKMNSHDHIIQAAGTLTTGGGFATFMFAATPYMQAISFLVMTAVGLATLIYTIKRIRRKD